MLRVTSFLRLATVALGIALGGIALGPATGGAAFAAPASGPQSAGQPPAGHPPAVAPALPAPGCTKPGVPLCMDDTTTFVSADKMSGCQFEVKEYVDKTMAYLKCLNDENIATGRDLTRNVDRFNCRLSGRKGCN